MRLKELGVKQESLFWYTCFNDGTADIHFQYDRKHIPPAHYSAFTVAELGEMLPAWFDSAKRKTGDWVCRFMEKTRDLNHHSFGETEADARAKMLVFLIENKLMELPRET